MVNLNKLTKRWFYTSTGAKPSKRLIRKGMAQVRTLSTLFLLALASCTSYTCPTYAKKDTITAPEPKNVYLQENERVIKTTVVVFILSLFLTLHILAYQK